MYKEKKNHKALFRAKEQIENPYRYSISAKYAD